jgi:outer membrane protein OmpA-like peptidoglycan-associated protein
MKRVIAMVVAAWLVSAGHAAAQAVSNGGTEDRPATTSLTGDTGIWFVSTGEVLPAKRVSFSFARTESDFDQGFTDVSSWPVSVGVGIGGRAEVFGSLRTVTRVDRDTRPLFFQGSDNEPGGLVNEFPSTRESWSGNKFGDLLIGGKINLLSEQRRQPLALAVRATTKIPTGDQDSGASTGSWDWFLDAKEATQTLETAIEALKRNQVFGLTIEGHTCNIGTAEYNMALGERRANAVREYLVSRGIAAERLHTVSYGEERPKYDNSMDPPRRLNRRAALTVRVTTTQP